MTYTKPEIIKVAKAEAAIQHSSVKGSPFLIDANPQLGNTATSAAYEGDE